MEERIIERLRKNNDLYNQNLPTDILNKELIKLHYEFIEGLK